MRTGRPSLEALVLAGILALACAEQDEHLCPQTCEELVLDEYVEINGTSDLSVLEGVTHVRGVLRIKHNLTLRHLDELSCLRRVDGELELRDNKRLASLEGLGCLVELGDDLQISDNPALTDLAGLRNLRELAGDLSIYDNGQLRNVDALDGIDAIGGDLHVTNSPALDDLSGLSNVRVVGGNLGLNGLPLTDLEDLAAIETVGKDIDVSFNDNLTSVGALHGITSFDRYYYIAANHQLPTCDAESLRDHLLSTGWDGEGQTICGTLEDECGFEECEWCE